MRYSLFILPFLFVAVQATAAEMLLPIGERLPVDQTGIKVTVTQQDDGDKRRCLFAVNNTDQRFLNIFSVGANPDGGLELPEPPNGWQHDWAAEKTDGPTPPDNWFESFGSSALGYNLDWQIKDMTLALPPGKSVQFELVIPRTKAPVCSSLHQAVSLFDSATMTAIRDAQRQYEVDYFPDGRSRHIKITAPLDKQNVPAGETVTITVQRDSRLTMKRIFIEVTQPQAGNTLPKTVCSVEAKMQSETIYQATCTLPSDLSGTLVLSASAADSPPPWPFVFCQGNIVQCRNQVMPHEPRTGSPVSIVVTPQQP